MSLYLNRNLAATKQKQLQSVGDIEFSDNLGRSGDNFVDFVLTAAQMDALNATPITVLAAPGSGYVNVCTGLFLKINSTGYTAFELGSGVLEFRYTNASGAKVVTDIANASVESSTDLDVWSPAIVASVVENAVICAHASADVTAGTGNIQGRLFYKTIKLAEIV